MDEDVQIVDVNETEREIDELKDGVCKEKESLNRLLCLNLLGMAACTLVL